MLTCHYLWCSKYPYFYRTIINQTTIQRKLETLLTHYKNIILFSPPLLDTSSLENDRKLALHLQTLQVSKHAKKSRYFLTVFKSYRIHTEDNSGHWSWIILPHLHASATYNFLFGIIWYFRKILLWSKIHALYYL